MTPYTFKAIPAAIVRTVDRNWTHAFLVWLDGVIANLIGGGSGPGFGPVRLMTAANPNAYTYDPDELTITFNVVGSQSVDGSATVAGDRVWLNHGAAATDNGPYEVTTKGTGGVHEVWTRTADGDESADFVAGKLITTGPDGATLANIVKELTVADGFELDTDDVTIGDESNVLTTNTAQTVTGAKRFTTLLLKVWNVGKTFAHSFAGTATADRTVTLPDVDLTVAQAGVATGAGGTGASGATAPAFTGTTPISASQSHLTGVGMTAVGQVMTSTDNVTVAADELAGMFLTTATLNGLLLIVSNTVAAGAPVAITVLGPAVTDAGAYKVVKGPTPAGTVASHTHTGPSHTHAQT